MPENEVCHCCLTEEAILRSIPRDEPMMPEPILFWLQVQHNRDRLECAKAVLEHFESALHTLELEGKIKRSNRFVWLESGEHNSKPPSTKIAKVTKVKQTKTKKD